MALSLLSGGDTGAAARQKINDAIAAIGEANAATASLAGQTSSQVAAIRAGLTAVEQQLIVGIRVDGDWIQVRFNGSVDWINLVNLESLSGEDGTNGPPGDAVYSTTRPGDGPSSFTASLADLPSDQLPPLKGLPRPTYTGLVYPLTDGGIAAQREYVSIEPGHTYRARFSVHRISGPIDPEGDAIRFALALYNSAKHYLGELIVEDLLGLTSDFGRQERNVFVSLSTGTGLDYVLPAGTCYVRGYIKAFGTDQVSGAETIDVADITDVYSALLEKLVDPDTVPALNARVSDLEGQLAQLVNANGILELLTTTLHNLPTTLPADLGQIWWDGNVLART